MNRVKIIFGILLLGAALYYLDLLLTSSKVIDGSLLSRMTTSQPEKKAGFQTDAMNWRPYSEDLLALAKAQGKPVLIDFRADWCAACLEMEEKTFTDQGLQLLSGQFVLVKFDATQETPVLDKLKDKYGIVGLPTVIFLGKKGEWLKDLTLTEFEEPGPFRERMQKALR